MAFQAKDSAVLAKQLKVQELDLTSKDYSQILVDNGADQIVIIGEAVGEVNLVVLKDDSANALVHFAAASISIVDSTAYTAGGDSKAIKIAGLASVDANDCLIVKYSVQE